jgi:hypothetical protein
MKMMKRFVVFSTDTILGAFEAEDEQQAIDACAREAGYESEHDMARQLNEARPLAAEEETEFWFMIGVDR